MTRYTADSKDRVRDAVDMLALVSPRSELRRAGVNSYFGLCPFHDERTGSFHVLPDDKKYHCFGCQASGDAFSFVMETEGLNFVGALEMLADRFGVKLETEDEDPAAAARRQRRERLYELLGRATTYYARYLWEGKEAAGARAYLIGRGLSEETLREFRVGMRRARGTGSCSPRAGPGSPTRSCSPSGSPSAHSRDRGRSSTASGSGSCSRSRTRADACSASGRARCARTSARST